MYKSKYTESFISIKGFGKSKNNTDKTEPLLRESKESSPKSGTEGILILSYLRGL